KVRAVPGDTPGYALPLKKPLRFTEKGTAPGRRYNITMRFYMRKIKGLRWYMIALVTLGTVLGYLTRNTVASAAPTLMEELHISTQQYSYIIAAYSAAYTVMQPIAGYVLDILGTKIGYAFFAVAWAVFCGATALAGSWGGLALARGAVGAAEAAMIPA